MNCGARFIEPDAQTSCTASHFRATSSLLDCAKRYRPGWKGCRVASFEGAESAQVQGFPIGLRSLSAQIDSGVGGVGRDGGRAQDKRTKVHGEGMSPVPRRGGNRRQGIMHTA